MGQSRSPLGVVDLELLAARGWRAPEQERLGNWLLRAGGGFTDRANSTLVVGEPGRPLPEAVDAVTQWYAERGLRPTVQLPGVQARAAAAAFAAAGWDADEDVLVLTAPLPSRDDDGRFDVSLSRTPDDAWLAGYRYRDAPLPSNAVDVLGSAEQTDDLAFAAVRRGPAPAPLAAVARGVVVGNWLGVTAVTVAEEHRRQGLAGAVMAALYRWAAGRGAEWVYLQVRESNAPARALYRREGFVEHHRYAYRRAPS